MVFAMPSCQEPLSSFSIIRRTSHHYNPYRNNGIPKSSYHYSYHYSHLYKFLYILTCKNLYMRMYKQFCILLNKTLYTRLPQMGFRFDYPPMDITVRN